VAEGQLAARQYRDGHPRPVFGASTFQVLGSRLKPGCAETAIVNGLLDLIQAEEK
jgi:hypothetical protein